MNAFDYAKECQEASERQGITAIVDALADFGIKASSEQTGGFTMCAYVQLTETRYIYANLWGASVYSNEDYLYDIIQFDEPQTAQKIALDIHNYINA